ncbi:membrane protein [Mycolicibacterium goodii]|uniref:Membrane protein n=1 Tax=Mycolicibacterium goodii TaxID=134601 RepID=A0A0K0XFK4_MYCGD|nr:membrane protein [Mycolicibacterium goodii]
MTAPLLAPGYLLLRDAVSTPRSYLTDAALGLTEAAPRALPQDFAVALASSVLDGGVVVKALLIAGLWAAGWGAARLVALVIPDAGPGGRFTAATLAVWNPYVAERLLQGHWSLLVGYGCLPWVAVSVLRLRERGSFDAAAGVLFWIALAGLTPTGLVLAATVALVCVAAPGDGWAAERVAGLGLGVAVLAACPWLVAAFVGEAVASSPDPSAGVRAFAARAEPGLATLGSLAGLGGIWNGDAVPASRTSLFAVLATVVLVGVVVAGLPLVARRPAAVPLLVLAAVAVVGPALIATGPGLAVVETVVDAVPGLGIVRDGQKWVALAMPGYALAAGAAPMMLRRLQVPAAPAMCCVALIAVLPDLAWGVGNQMRAVQYPPSWAAAAATINADPRPVVALPADSIREFSWAGTVLDPLPRWLRADVLTTGDLLIGGRVVPGEGARAREVQGLLLAGASPQQLANLGVGWVVRESDTGITVQRIGGDAPASPHRGLLIAAHLVWLTVLAGGAVGMVAAVLRRRRWRRWLRRWHWG